MKPYGVLPVPNFTWINLFQTGQKMRLAPRYHKQHSAAGLVGFFNLLSWLSARLQAYGVNNTLFNINSNQGTFEHNSVMIRLPNVQLQESKAEGVQYTPQAFHIKPAKFEPRVLK